jgi:mRNA interferase MazF
MISRGDIRWFRFSSPDKKRPVLVLGKQTVLPSLSQIPVIPLSTQSRSLEWEVSLTPEDGVPADCVLKPEWIKAVDRTYLGPLISTLPETRWDDVRTALLIVLGLNNLTR